MHFFVKRIMKKIINAAIIFSLVYINNCSSIVEENDKPITQPVDIIWSKTGLDSCWVYSMVFMDNGDFFAGTSCGLLFSAVGQVGAWQTRFHLAQLHVFINNIPAEYSLAHPVKGYLHHLIMEYPGTI